MRDIIKSPATCAGSIFTEETVDSITTVTLKSCRCWGEFASRLDFGLALIGVKEGFLTAAVTPNSNVEETIANIGRRSLDICRGCDLYKPKQAA